MNSKRFLIKLRYLGFRYHGVQKQPGYLSIQGKIEEVLSRILATPVQTRFSSRTDSRVSSLESYCLLMFEKEMAQALVREALENLPPDLEVRTLQNVADNYVLLNHSGEKEYHYYFCFNQPSFHPFASAFMTHIREELDIEEMKLGAKLFLGEHDFINYTHKLKPNSKTIREISFSTLEKNEELTASFFPLNSYVFKVKAQGFMRGQVRTMMGALFRLGKNELSLHELKLSLEREDPAFVKWQAPASGLILQTTAMK